MKYVLLALVFCLHSTAFSANPFDQFDQPGQHSVILGESIILVIPALIGIWILLREVFRIPILLLRLASANEAFRLVLGILDWILMMGVVFLLIAASMACRQEEMGLPFYLWIGVISGVLGWGLRISNGILMVFTEAVFWALYHSGNYRVAGAASGTVSV